MKKPLKIPEYFKDLSDNANLNSRDVAEIFGYKMKAIHEAISRGRVPMPDKHMRCGSEYKCFVRTENPDLGSVRVFWKVKTIREWI